MTFIKKIENIVPNLKQLERLSMTLTADGKRRALRQPLIFSSFPLIRK